MSIQKNGDADESEQDGTTDEERAGTDESERDDVEESAAPTRIEKDAVFHLLQNKRRRAVLRYILDHDDQERFVMRDLAEEVAAWEHDTTIQQLTSDERQRVYIALYQSHLPKFDEHGVVDYDQSRGIVERTPLTAVFDQYLDHGLDGDSPITTERGQHDENRSNLTTTVSSLFNR